MAMLVLSACGGSNGGGARAAGEYPGDPDLGPEAVARAYVEALDERDGKRFCSVVAPYISGRFDLATSDPESLLRDMDGCPDLVSSLIGIVEDCCPPEFKGAKVERIHGVERRGELRMVRARVRVQIVQNQVPRTDIVNSVIWTARLAGAWRVAKLEEVASLASIRIEQLGPTPDFAAPPDVAAERREFAGLVAEGEQKVEQHEASYRPLGPAVRCPGGASVGDPEGDQIWNGAATKSGDPPRVRGGDLLGVDVVVKGELVCVRWRLAGTPDPPISLSYNHRTGPTSGTFSQGFDIEVREDRTARVVSGQDDDGRPIPVPAEVGADESSVSLALDAESFRAGQAYWTSTTPPPLERFGFSAGTAASAGESSSVLDSLGSAPSDTYRYSDARLCDFEGC
jgi:hypothetical protein